MKKISKLICLILSFIFTFTCIGCFTVATQDKVNDLVASLELEIEGYDLEFCAEPLEFARVYSKS